MHRGAGNRRTVGASGLIVLAVMMLFGGPARAQAAQPPPSAPAEPIQAGSRPETGIHRGLVIAGASMFGGMWLLSALVGALLDASNQDFGGNNDSAAWPLYVPVVGPFIAMPVFDLRGPGTFLLAFDGLAQASGAAMLIVGLATTQQRLSQTGERKPSVTVLPLRLGKDGLGLGLVGTM